GRTSGPHTHACSAPVRTSSGSARPPTSSSMASTTIVLPAPVSPVTAAKPVTGTGGTARITPRRPDTTPTPGAPRRRSPVAQPELGLQDAQEVAGPERHEPPRQRGGGAGHGVAPAERAGVVAVDGQGGRPGG